MIRNQRASVTLKWTGPQTRRKKLKDSTKSLERIDLKSGIVRNFIDLFVYVGCTKSADNISVVGRRNDAKNSSLSAALNANVEQIFIEFSADWQ